MSLVSSAKVKGHRLLLTVGVVLISAFLSFCIFVSNLRVSMPDFFYLSTIFSLPFIYKLIVLGIFILFAVYYIYKKRNIIILVCVAISFIVVFFSTYNLITSTGANSISSSIGPFAIRKVPLSSDLKIKKTWWGYQVFNSEKSIPFLTNVFLFGSYSKTINTMFSKLGNCIQKKKELCTEIDVVWP